MIANDETYLAVDGDSFVGQWVVDPEHLRDGIAETALGSMFFDGYHPIGALGSRQDGSMVERMRCVYLQHSAFQSLIRKGTRSLQGHEDRPWSGRDEGDVSSVAQYFRSSESKLRPFNYWHWGGISTQP